MSQAVYSCDHCSAAVELHAQRCPACGKVFDAVRCPKCGHQGAPSAFSNGCPKCRYLARPPAAEPARPARRSLFGPVMVVLLALLSVTVAVAWVLRGG